MVEISFVMVYVFVLFILKMKKEVGYVCEEIEKIVLSCFRVSEFD